MKQVNLKNIITNKITGPYYLIENENDLIRYSEDILGPKLTSAFTYLLQTSIKEKLSDKLDHCITKSRSDYGEQTMLVFESAFKKQGMLQTANNIHIEKIKGMLECLSNNGALIINQNGGYQPLKNSSLEITDKEVISENEKSDVLQATFLFNENNKNTTIVLENDFEISSSLKKKITSYQYDRIYNLKSITSIQLKLLIQKLNTIYDIVIFESQFVNIVQIECLIKVFCSITKPLTFYILSNKTIEEVIEKYCSNEDKISLKKHTFIQL